MQIELKILNKRFYSEESNGMLLNPLPGYSTPGSAAIDLVCTEDVTIYPGETKMIHTGLAIWIGSDQHQTDPSHTVSQWLSTVHTQVSIAGLILPRSGLGTKGLILANTIGLIDEDYQGELKVSAWNRNQDKIETFDDCHYDEWVTHTEITKGDTIELKAGDRFAQLMVIPVIKAQFNVVEEFSGSTQRDKGGFGSTGA